MLHIIKRYLRKKRLEGDKSILLNLEIQYLYISKNKIINIKINKC